MVMKRWSASGWENRFANRAGRSGSGFDEGCYAVLA
jgi:hypothetical protein